MSTITVATLNLWGLTGAWRERMQLAARQLSEFSCQALLLQEVSSPERADNVEILAEELGMSASRLPVRESDFGLAILSKLELGEARRTRLPAPAEEQRWLLSVHLPESHCWLHCTHLSHELGAGAWREKQVLHIANTIGAIDSEALHLLGGDMNAAPDSDEMRFLRGLCTLEGQSIHMQDCWLRHQAEDASGHTWSMQSGEERARRSNDVNRRIDYLYASTRRKDEQGQVEESGKVCDRPDEAGLHASDHCGVWARIHLGKGTSGEGAGR
jgi:endonuclease/exonuclease/phosphatase family metal-dependent hydrolase